MRKKSLGCAFYANRARILSSVGDVYCAIVMEIREAFDTTGDSRRFAHGKHSTL